MRTLKFAFFMWLVACGDSGSSAGGSSSSSGGNSEGGGGSGTGAIGAGAGGSGSGAGGVGGQGGGGGSGGTGAGGVGGAPPECAEEVTNIPAGECDLYLQDCPDGKTCGVFDDPAQEGFQAIANCLDQNGLKGPGDACTAASQCEPHLTCVGEVCTPYCCPGDDSTCDGGSCSVNVTITLPEGGPSDFHFQACSYSATCNLFDPSSCPADENCYLNSGDGVGECYTPADLPEVPDGGACGAANACLDSAVCLTTDETNYFCHYLCQEGSNAAPGLGGCPAGQMCSMGFESGIAGVGACQKPDRGSRKRAALTAAFF